MTTTPDAISDILHAALPTLDETERQVSLALYRRLAEGAPVPSAEIAAALGLDPAAVEQILSDWPGVYRDADGSVVGYWGLTVQPMGHAIAFDGRELYAWCAWDTLFLPELVGRRAEVRSKTPSGREVRLVVDPDGSVRAEPDGLHISIVVPEGPLGGDVISSFCHHVLFFEDRAAGEVWADGRSDIVLLPLQEAIALGRRKNAAMYGSALQ